MPTHPRCSCSHCGASLHARPCDVARVQQLTLYVDSRIPISELTRLFRLLTLYVDSRIPISEFALTRVLLVLLGKPRLYYPLDESRHVSSCICHPRPSPQGPAPHPPPRARPRRTPVTTATLCDPPSLVSWLGLFPGTEAFLGLEFQNIRVNVQNVLLF